jgi:hypothetical protein
MFLKKLHYLANDNYQNLPECNDKELGLIGLFFNGIDQHSYPRSTYAIRMVGSIRSTFRGPSGFENFLDAFYAIVEEDVKKCQVAKDLSMSLNLKTPSQNHSKSENFTEKKAVTNTKSKPFIPFKKGNRLTAMSAENEEETVDDYNEYGDYDLLEDPLDDDKNQEEKVLDPLDELNAMSSDNPNACFALLFHKECKNKDKC